MGNTLKNPVTDKETITGTLCSSPNTLWGTHKPQPNCTSFAISSCQGWRVTHEDAHFHKTRLFIPASLRDGIDSDGDGAEENKYLRDHAILGLFDGHGGDFASIYSSRNFGSIFYKQKEYTEYCRKYLDLHMQAMKSSKRKQKKGKGKNKCNGYDHFGLGQRIIDQDRSLLELLKAGLTKTFLEVDQQMIANMKQMEDEHKDSVKDTESGFDLMDAGTAALILLLTPNYIICANAGDCRAILCKRSLSLQPSSKEKVVRQSKGRGISQKSQFDVIPLSFDHKPDDPVEEKRIIQAGGSVLDGKVDGLLALSRGLGDFNFKHHDTVHGASEGSTGTGGITPEQQKVCSLPDITVVDRDETNDLFLVAGCDGIWDVTANEECADLISQIFVEGEANLGLLTEEMIDVCLEKGSTDNMSIAVVKFPSQEVGAGAGVMKRRQQRQAREYEKLARYMSNKRKI